MMILFSFALSGFIGHGADPTRILAGQTCYPAYLQPWRCRYNPLPSTKSEPRSSSGQYWWKIAEVLMEYAPLGLRLVQQGCDDVLKFKSEPHSCTSNADDSENNGDFSGCDDILKLESEPRNCSSSADDSVNRTGTLWFIKPVPLSVLAGFSAEKNGNFNAYMFLRQDRIQDSVQYRGFFVYAGCLISTLAVFLGIRDDPTRILAGQSADLQPWRRRLPVAWLRNRSEPHQNQFSSL
nr:hypothetical protein Iba_chr13bCG15720 [Ipomoea batatas]